MFSKFLSCLLWSFGRSGCVLAFCLALSALLLAAHPAHAAQLSLTWSDMSSNEDGFHIERKTGTGGSYATVATPPAGTTGYVDGTVSAGTSYCYRVHAWNTAGDSAYSNEGCAAAATPVTYAVTATKSGIGSGTVASSPNGIDCGSDCSENYTSGTSVALSATPAPGSTFTGWSGSCTTSPCTLIVDAAKSVTATFALSTFTLTATKAGTGSGTVTSSPTGVNCGTDCTENYASGTSVTLTAAAATGSTFTGWSGACTGTTATCQVTMSAARSVTATFTASAQSTFTLTAARNGAGVGVVASNPAGINCGSACSASFGSGTVVALESLPDAGSTFAGWSGGCTGTGSCTVTMSQARSVTSTFTLQGLLLNVAMSGSGSGGVTSAPTGIACGTDCSEVYTYNTNVTLTAAATTGSVFSGWSGACSGITATCTVAMNQAKNVTANFTAQATNYTLRLRKQGRGSGTVTSTPAGIACGSDCRESFAKGMSVTLSAVPASGSTFRGWTGACSGTGACTVTLTESTTVTATFQRTRY